MRGFRLRELVGPLATVLIAIAVTVPGTAAAAVPGLDTDVQSQIDAYLAESPGGVQTNATEISYAGGAFVVTFARPRGILAGPDCPAGWFCFYDGVNYGYPRGKLSSCGWQDLGFYGWSDRTESVHHNQAFGTVWFINHLSANHGSDVRLFFISTSVRARADVAPYRNMADHVYRFC